MIACVPEGLTDIYMPDARYGSNEAGELYSGIPGYFSCMCCALIKMQRQVGDLQLDHRGLAISGLSVRRPVMILINQNQIVDRQA